MNTRALSSVADRFRSAGRPARRSPRDGGDPRAVAEPAAPGRLLLALAVAAGVFGLAGCASPGGGGADGSVAGREAPRAAFYADWYDPTAVVLPPPPAEGR